MEEQQDARESTFPKGATTVKTAATQITLRAGIMTALCLGFIIYW